MRVFRHREDRLPIFLFSMLFAVDLAVYFWVDSVVLQAVYFVGMIVPKMGVAAFNHHHQHVPTFRVPLFNRLLELVYAFQTGISSQTWVLHHSLGHHVNYLDQAKDESRWVRDDGKPMGELEYSLSVTLTAYPRAWEVGARHPAQRRLFVWMGLLTVGLIAGLVWHRPVPGLFLFVLAPAFSVFATAWATFTHHAGRAAPPSHFEASNNIMLRLYNVFTGNLGYHTAHHYKPGVHWSKLPELHAQIAHQIPKDAYIQPVRAWEVADALLGQLLFALFSRLRRA